MTHTSRRSTSNGARSKRTRQTPGLIVEALESRALLTLTFGNTFGVSGSGAAGVVAAATTIDAAGNRVVAGSFLGTVNFGGTSLVSNGGRDAFVAKYNAAGQLLWANNYGGTGDDSASGVALDAAGNVYITGSLTGAVNFGGTQIASAGVEGYAAQLSPTGSLLLVVATGGNATSVQPHGIAVNPGGTQIAIGGSFTGTITFGTKTLTSTGASDGFVGNLVLAGANSTVWVSQLAGHAGATSQVNSVTIGPSGNVVVAGQFQGTVDFDPGSGVNTITSHGGSVDAFVEKFNVADGSDLFVDSLGGPGLDAAYGAAIDASGNILSLVAFQQTISVPLPGAPSNSLTVPAGSSGYMLVQLLGSGVTNSARQINALSASPFDSSYGTPALATNAQGTVAVAVTYTGSAGLSGLPSPPTAAGSDVLIETMDEQGDVYEFATAGGAGADSIAGVSIASTGAVAAVGIYQGPATFGSTTLQNMYTGQTGQNIFVTTLTPPTVIPGDFLGQGFTQPAVYHVADATWLVQGSSGTFAQFGWAGHDQPAPGDFDGTGVTQLAVYRPSTAQWFVRNVDGTTLALPTFGWVGHDIAVPADFDHVGVTEEAVYRPSTGQWFVNGPAGSRLVATFGWAGHDIPVPGDYLGLGYAQPAVYRPTTGEWFVLKPDGTTLALGAFGWAGHDIPVPGVYTQGGTFGRAVFRPTTAQWFLSNTSGVFTTFGSPTPQGTTPLVDYPAIAHTGTLNGLPTFGTGGIITNSVRSSAITAQAVTVTIGKTVPQALVAASPFTAKRLSKAVS